MPELIESDEGLQLILPKLKHPFILNFGDELDRRVQQGGELLWRATGAARPNPPSILDATAGLCRDAYLLASRGAKVVALEREFTLFRIASDALSRASNSVSQQLSLQHLNAHDVLRSLQNDVQASEFKDYPLPFGVIYLDPMFPTRQKSAAVSREAQVLQALTHHRSLSDLERQKEDRTLLSLALSCAYYRVVVKRPLKAPPLQGPMPSASLKGRAIRYDIYGIRSFQSTYLPQ